MRNERISKRHAAHPHPRRHAGGAASRCPPGAADRSCCNPVARGAHRRRRRRSRSRHGSAVSAAPKGSPGTSAELASTRSLMPRIPMRPSSRPMRRAPPPAPKYRCSRCGVRPGSRSRATVGAEVADVAGAVGTLGEQPRRVFLALGGKAAAAFAAAPQHHYLVRSVDAVEPQVAIAGAAYITGAGRSMKPTNGHCCGPDASRSSSRKNSGGTATYGKIAAARALGAAGDHAAPPRSARRARQSRPWRRRWRGSIMRRSRRFHAACRRGAVRPSRSTTRVCDEPTMTSVAMSAVEVRAAASVVTSTRSSGRPTARPKMTGVVAGRCRPSRSRAAPSCHGRARDTGL